MIHIQGRSYRRDGLGGSKINLYTQMATFTAEAFLERLSEATSMDVAKNVKAKHKVHENRRVEDQMQVRTFLHSVTVRRNHKMSGSRKLSWTVEQPNSSFVLGKRTMLVTGSTVQTVSFLQSSLTDTTKITLP